MIVVRIIDRSADPQFRCSKMGKSCGEVFDCVKVFDDQIWSFHIVTYKEDGTPKWKCQSPRPQELFCPTVVCPAWWVAEKEISHGFLSLSLLSSRGDRIGRRRGHVLYKIMVPIHHCYTIQDSMRQCEFSHVKKTNTWHANYSTYYLYKTKKQEVQFKPTSTESRWPYIKRRNQYRWTGQTAIAFPTSSNS